MKNRRYFAAINSMGFANSWRVMVFDNKSDRDDFVSRSNGAINRSGNCTRVLSINKSEVTGYAANWSMSENRAMKPRPFTGEHWIIEDVYDDYSREPGCIGEVGIGGPNSRFERLF